MKPTTVAFLTAAGMLLTSLTVYSVTPPGGFRPSERVEVTDELGRGEPLVVARDDRDPRADGASRFDAGNTLHVAGRLGHERLAAGGRGETYVLLEVRGTDAPGVAAAAPVNLALVVDRSGSMKGARLRNAIAGAVGAVERLHDGDVVSVVTFDTTTQLVVPPTTLDPLQRERVLSSIRSITLGSDTCISCGLEEAMTQLDRTSGRVNKMILLSDGDANRGVRDVAGFRALGRRAQARGLGVTTIGVDVDYNEKIMSAIAIESNGRHFFVENDADLGRVFASEAETATSAVAADAEARIDLAPGVELAEVLDRSFRREGGHVVVPLGTFTRGEEKTVLLRVRVPVDRTGAQPVASVDLGYRDLVQRDRGHCEGRLATFVTADPRDASELDPIVAGRVQRSETASVLTQANDLFAQGRADEAQRRLKDRARALDAAGAVAKQAAPAARAADVARDFDGQRAALDQATQGFAAPPAASAAPEAARAAKSAAKRNAASAVEMGF
jgi:Ca-activated chloride channel family protein